jgi:hypothetical protein
MNKAFVMMLTRLAKKRTRADTATTWRSARDRKKERKNDTTTKKDAEAPPATCSTSIPPLNTVVLV